MEYIETWSDLRYAGDVFGASMAGFYINESTGGVCYKKNNFIDDSCRTLFATEKEAKRARAAAIISQLMPFYGDAISDNEWGDSGMKKYVITRSGNSIKTSVSYDDHSLLAFRDDSYREDFLKNCEDLVKDYLMIE